MTRATTRAARAALVLQRYEDRQRLIGRVIELDAQGMKGGDIAKEVGHSPMAVSRILTASGRRKKTRGVRRPIKRPMVETPCTECGTPFTHRKDHDSKLCKECRRKVRLGVAPPNKGSTDGQVQRKCKECGEFFTVHRSRLKQRPNYRWASYCSKTCYGLAMQTPGSRYSEVGKNFPSRRHGRRR